MEYAKPWRSIDEQIDALVAKGMACCRDDLAEKLREVGYYRLSAYWYPYKVRNEAGESFFRSGTTFDNVWRAYLFDRELRVLMFRAVSRIEVYLRGQLAYRAAGLFGPFGYPEQDRPRLLREYRLARKGEVYIRHFEQEYGDSHELPPYWMMVEASTMGTIEALYLDADPSIRIGVANELGVKVPVFRNWLSVLRVARNACCHHARVWNRVWGVKPSIPKGWGTVEYGNDRTFAVLTVIITCFAKSMREMHGLARLMNCWRSTRMSRLPKRQDFQMTGGACRDGGIKTTPLPPSRADGHFDFLKPNWRCADRLV